jgi:vacuolar-type H+-ATPase subunit H
MSPEEIKERELEAKKRDKLAQETRQRMVDAARAEYERQLGLLESGK